MTQSAISGDQLELPPDKHNEQSSKSFVLTNEEPNMVVKSEETKVQLQARATPTQVHCRGNPRVTFRH
ncbi:hypothetical protein HAX54_001078 [Datura stramonium]|uniref:Uncharacterized protein n=1 Tax=Datura stramonium TaxID=4076 RepID=A0ABS8WQH8_DATST|nr:hypothetical protein [Datura stramonium]